MVTVDDEQDPTSTTEVPSSHEMPDVEVDLGSPLNIPGTDVAVSPADLEVERAPDFGTPLLPLSTDSPPPSVPDENKGKDVPRMQPTLLHKGGIFSTLLYSSAYTLSRVKESRKNSFLERQRQQDLDKGSGSEKSRSGDGQNELTRMISMLPLISITSCLTICIAVLRMFDCNGIRGLGSHNGGL